MKKVIKVTDIDCANCASKLEQAIAKIDGVKEVSISFLNEKMIIDIEDEKYQLVVKEIIKTKKKIEPDCEIIGL